MQLLGLRRFMLPLLAVRKGHVKMHSSVSAPMVESNDPSSEFALGNATDFEKLKLPSYTYEDEKTKEDFEAMLTIETDAATLSSPAANQQRLGDEQRSMMSELSSFTLPLLLVWLASPLLSLADSMFVGAMRSTTELAALGPACALTDNAYFAATFVSVVTTSAVATFCAKNDNDAAKAAAAASVFAALAIGAALTAAFSFSSMGEAVVAGLVGSGGAEIKSEALAYVKARSLGFAPALVSSVLQATSLARRDVSIPVKAAVVAGLVNLVGDALLVPVAGVSGAAYATTLAQIVSCFVVVKGALAKQYFDVTLAAAKTAARKTRRGVANIFRNGAPVLATLLAKCAVLSALAYSSSVSAGARGAVHEVAAHQILLGLYFVFAPVGDALSQTVQTFVPRALSQDENSEQKTPRKNKTQRIVAGPAARAVIDGALRASLALGAVDALLAFGVPGLSPQVFSSDPDVISALRSTAPLMSISLLIHAACASLEGTMLALRDASFLSAVYATNSVIFVAAFVALAHVAAPLGTIWTCFFGYQVARFLALALRVVFTNRRPRNQVQEPTPPQAAVPAH